MAGITFDTGALIALSRGEKRMRTVLLAAQERRAVITIPTAVIAEWWREDTKRSRMILARTSVEPLSERVAKLAGAAIAAVPGSTPIDAVVMASAAQRGDVVLTSDFEDLERLRGHFPEVQILRV